MQKTFTKIIATLGPATASKENIFTLVKAGTNLFRLNFSHGTVEDHKCNMSYIREAEEKFGFPIGVICDMQGPKLRIGTFKKDSVLLQNGSLFRLDMNSELGDETRVNLPHKEIYQAVDKGDYLLLNDGNIRLRVLEKGLDFLNTEVVVGGTLSAHKGVNVPGVSLPISALTEKDLSNLEAALNMGADWIALSFVQRVEDILMAREKINGRAWIITKIEKPAALSDLKGIVAASDAVMVARGDLGVESPLEKLPSLQKNIVAECRLQGKPVIIATQMLESMIKNPTPTRAEVSDIATAVYDGVDCVMLSGETAVGSYPELAVSIMRKIILNTEQDELYKKLMEVIPLPNDHEIATAITSAIDPMIKVLRNPTCVAAYSMSGATTLRVARERPPVPILNMTYDQSVMRRMTLVWGVYSIQTEQVKLLTEVTPIAENAAKELGFARPGDDMILTAGIPFAEKGNTNIIHVFKVK